MDRSELLDLIPAYALDALEADEKLQVEALLRTDAEARRLLAEYEEITATLVLATPALRAPAHLQDDLRKRLAANRPAQTAPTASIPLMPASPVRRRRPVWLPLAAAAVIVLVFGAVNMLNRNPAEQLYNQLKNTAGHVVMAIAASDEDAPDGELVISADGQQAVMRLSRMPTLTADRTFQLWLIDGNGAHSGGLFPFSGSDATYYVALPLEKAASDYSAFGVSVEPAGGSPSADGPSTTPIVVVTTA